METKKNSSTLINLEVKLNKDGTISFDYNLVYPDYPHTHTIAAMIRNTVNELDYVGSEMQKLLKSI
jgi:hypothetical protein